MEAPDPIPNADHGTTIEEVNKYSATDEWQIPAIKTPPRFPDHPPTNHQVSYGIPKSFGKPKDFDLAGGKSKWPDEVALASPELLQCDLTVDTNDLPASIPVVPFVSMGYEVPSNSIGKAPCVYCGNAPIVSCGTDSRGYTERHKIQCVHKLYQFNSNGVLRGSHQLKMPWSLSDQQLPCSGIKSTSTSWYDTGDPKDSPNIQYARGKGECHGASVIAVPQGMQD